MAVTNIIFTGKGANDYLLSKQYKQVFKPGKTQKEYDIALKMSMSERRKKYGFHWKDKFFSEKEDGLKNILAYNCLINKEIIFDTNKINIIFGPNASGKTTILKTIAAHALCGDSDNFDGFTNIMQTPSSFMLFNKEGIDIESFIYNKAKNSAIVSWDGNPVYYHNFENRVQTGSLSDYENSILGNVGNALLYSYNKSQMNSGKVALYIFHQLYNIAKMNPSVEEIISTMEQQCIKCNDLYIDTYKQQKDYVLSHYDNTIPQQNTILLDEIDRNLDIISIVKMYTKYIPELQSLNNQQIIMVSHSPLILSENICNPEKYNIISLNEDYTSEVKTILKNIKF